MTDTTDGKVDTLRAGVLDALTSELDLVGSHLALGDDLWLTATTARLAVDGQRLDAILTAAGCKIVGGTALFRLAHHFDAQAMIARLGQHGIHVRGFEREPQWIRFGVPANPHEFNRLTKAFNL